VTVGAEWTDDKVAIVIADDGPGFSATVIDRIGEPYVTTRQGGQTGGEADHEAGGLGLGLFIAKTLLERSGAVIDLANRAAPRKGAVVRVAWPRPLMDLPAVDSGVATIG
jgi:two-component system sensor histidine kinase RegB